MNIPAYESLFTQQYLQSHLIHTYSTDASLLYNTLCVNLNRYNNASAFKSLSVLYSLVILHKKHPKEIIETLFKNVMFHNESYGAQTLIIDTHLINEDECNETIEYLYELIQHLHACHSTSAHKLSTVYILHNTGMSDNDVKYNRLYTTLFVHEPSADAFISKHRNISISCYSEDNRTLKELLEVLMMIKYDENNTVRLSHDLVLNSLMSQITKCLRKRQDIKTNLLVYKNNAEHLRETTVPVLISNIIFHNDLASHTTLLLLSLFRECLIGSSSTPLFEYQTDLVYKGKDTISTLYLISNMVLLLSLSGVENADISEYLDIPVDIIAKQKKLFNIKYKGISTFDE